MRAIALLLVVVGCSLEVDRSGVYNKCNPPDNTCDGDYVCVDGYCLPKEPPPPGCSSIVSAGSEHTCALRDDGEVWCWGLNDHGQLGNMGTTNEALPVQVMGLTGMKVMDAGNGFACAADATHVMCWGQNNESQLGDNSMVDGKIPVEAGMMLAGVKTLSAGGNHVCALTEAGAVSCWGANNEGQIGDGTQSRRAAPTPLATPPMKAISAGALHTCAIDMGGTLYCWGNNDSGELGRGMTSNFEATPAPVPGLNGVTAVATGDSFTCALADIGLVCFGYNGQGQLGIGTTTSTPTPTFNRIPIAVKEISAGYQHACAWDVQHDVWCWGQNNEAQLGDGTVIQRTVPVKNQLTGAFGITTGSYHSCMIAEDGGITCVGSNVRGQLGDSKRTATSLPLTVPDVAGAVTVGAGGSHSCASLMDGTVKCWGANDSGEVGDGSFTTRTKATPVVSLSNVDRVLGGGGHSCAWLKDKSIRCWGNNGYGELGDGTNQSSSLPRPVTLSTAPSSFELGGSYSCAIVNGAGMCWGSGQTLATDVGNGQSGLYGIARGDNHACAILSDRSVKCWGASNMQGQLGKGDMMDPPSPTDIFDTGVRNAAKIYITGDSTCALLMDGTASCWGRNNANWFGIQGATNPVLSPQPVVGLTGAVSLGFRRAGSNDDGICARKSDATVACWGANTYGQLGDGTYIGKTAPTTVPGVTGVVDVAVGGYHACAAKMDGTVMCWGADTSGQLGDGIKRVLTPVGARMTCPN